MPNPHKDDSSPAGGALAGRPAHRQRHDRRDGLRPHPQRTILLNHETLWRRSAPPQMVDVSQHLPELRALLHEGRYDEATSFLTTGWWRQGFASKRTDPYQPAFDLKVDTEPAARSRRYRGEVDFATGEVTVVGGRGRDGEWTSYQRKLFVSRRDGVVVLAVRASRCAAGRGQLPLSPGPSAGTRALAWARSRSARARSGSRSRRRPRTAG